MLKNRMVEIMEARMDHKANSLDLGKLMGAFLNDPDPDATIAKNREINEALIDMMKQTMENKGIPKRDLEGLPVSFSKRQKREDLSLN